jgi:hypothetical protein
LQGATAAARQSRFRAVPERGLRFACPLVIWRAKRSWFTPIFLVFFILFSIFFFSISQVVAKYLSLTGK